MTDDEIERTAVRHAVAHSRDRGTHRWLTVFRVGMVVSILCLGVLVLLLFVRQETRDKSALELVRQVQAQCDTGAFTGSVCTKADAVERDVKTVQIPGADGRDGTDGRDGVDGKDGKDGKPGRDGEDGADGADGADGEDGLPGINGINGLPGLSAYDTAVQQGFQGTVDEWLASLRGPAGKDGPAGKSAWPFRFKLVIPGGSPVEEDRTYLVECVTPGESCKVTDQTPAPPVPTQEPTQEPAGTVG